jgi:hypothetical protein
LAAHKDYSATPLPRKLGIRDGSRVALVAAPDGFAEHLGIEPRTRGPADVIVVFAMRAAELRRRFPALVRRLDEAGGLWVAWPKQAARVETDLDFDTVQRIGLDEGVVDNKSCSIDQTYQGLRFVVRLQDRGK